MSINALMLHHDCLKGHTTCKRRRRRGGGSNGGGWRIHHLGLWPLRTKLGLALLNKHCANGTHDSVERRIRNWDRKMMKHPCDSRRKNELIMGCHISIDIYDRDNEMRREVYKEVL